MDIAKLRKDLGLTQTTLAKKCEVSLTTIRMWEQEVTTPTKANMDKLKEVLKVGK